MIDFVARPINMNMNRATSRTVAVCTCSLRSVSTQAAVKFITDIKTLTPVLEYDKQQNDIRCIMIPLMSTGESHPTPISYYLSAALALLFSTIGH